MKEPQLIIVGSGLRRRFAECAPWLVVAGISAVAAGLFLGFNAWASEHAPALSMAHPWIALPGLLLAILVCSIWVLPGRDAGPADSEPPAEADEEAAADAPEWTDLARSVVRDLRESGFAVPGSEDTWQAGSDLIVRRGWRAYIVRARYWSEPLVKSAAAHELVRDVARCSAAGGVLVSGIDSFSVRAHQLARIHGIALLGPAGFAEDEVFRERLQQTDRADAGKLNGIPPERVPVLRDPVPPEALRAPATRPGALATANNAYEATVPMALT